MGIKSKSGETVMEKPKEGENHLPKSQATVASVGPEKNVFLGIGGWNNQIKMATREGWEDHQETAKLYVILTIVFSEKHMATDYMCKTNAQYVHNTSQSVILTNN